MQNPKADRSWLPLHQACREKQPLALITKLVESQPASLAHWAATPEDPSELRLPLHVACESGASLQVVRYLAEQHPSSLNALAAKKMYTALDFALYYFHSLPEGSTDDCKIKAESVVNWLSNPIKIQEQQGKFRPKPVFRRKSKASKIIRIRLPSRE